MESEIGCCTDCWSLLYEAMAGNSMSKNSSLPSAEMKILFATGTVGRGGKERQLCILAKTLRDQGAKIKIVTHHVTSENYIQEYGLVPDILLPYQAKGWLRKYFNFRRIILDERPDLIVSWDFPTSLFSLLLYKKCRSKFINFSIQHGIRLWKPSHLFRSLVCHLSPLVMANSLAGLRANNLKPGKGRFVLYNGIEDKFINKMSQADINRKRQRLIPGYEQKPGIVYISVANFVPYKDYFTVLKALADLKEQKSFYYFIIGDGPMRREVERTIRAYDLQDRIILTGRIENVSDYLFSSDILIHSSRGEGVSNAILEAMFAGLPVIATTVGGVPETVYPGSSLLFPYQDSRALLDRLLAAPLAFKDFDPRSETYRQHLDKFTVSAMTARFEMIRKEIGN
jgi:glycosyltransferase involved in cell wall biosynthesis